jgi:hypothetical protein
MNKKRFYLKIKKGNRTIYKNETGKIVTAENVKKGKRKIIEVDENESKDILLKRNVGIDLIGLEKNSVVEVVKNGRKKYISSTGRVISKKDIKSKKVLTIVGSGTLKGQILPKKIQVKTKKRKPITKGKSISFGLLNVNVISEFNLALEKGFKVYVKNSESNEILELYSQASKANFLLFFTKINKKFFEIFKKFSEYPFFQISLIENKKERKSIFDFTELSYKSKGKINNKVSELFTAFQKYVITEFQNTFI